MQEARSYAYSLCQIENGWQWSVYDENGETIAGGSDQTRAAALAAVETLLKGSVSMSARSDAA